MRKVRKLEEKRKMKELVKQKQREKREIEDEIELKNLKNETEVWKVETKGGRRKIGESRI